MFRTTSKLLSSVVTNGTRFPILVDSSVLVWKLQNLLNPAKPKYKEVFDKLDNEYNVYYTETAATLVPLFPCQLPSNYRYIDSGLPEELKNAALKFLMGETSFALLPSSTQRLLTEDIFEVFEAPYSRFVKKVQWDICNDPMPTL